MIDAARSIRRIELDQPWRRVYWIVPASIAIWAILLGCFSLVLMRTSAPPPAELKPIDARLIEIPPPVAGLQGGGGATPHAAPRPAAPPKSHPQPIAKPHPVSRPRAISPGPPMIHSKAATTKSSEAPAAQASSGAVPGGAEKNPAGNSGSGGEPGAIGNDTVGARAIYAPTPEIPNDLREDSIDTEAIARFKVSSDGTAAVTLEKATSNPRLNQVLLDTLKQWKFSPAVRDGVAIESSFEVQIPISVQ